MNSTSDGLRPIAAIHHRGAGRQPSRRAELLSDTSFYLNTKPGGSRTTSPCDVWQFLQSNFPVRPRAPIPHALRRVGGAGSGRTTSGSNTASSSRFSTGFLPALNLRYEDCHGRYFAHFDPSCTGPTQRLRPWQPVARYYGVIAIRQKQFRGRSSARPQAIQRIADENPVEMLDSRDIRPDEFDMFVGYGGRDEFNIDAQVESFLYVVVPPRCLTVKVVLRPARPPCPSHGDAIVPGSFVGSGPFSGLMKKRSPRSRKPISRVRSRIRPFPRSRSRIVRVGVLPAGRTVVKSFLNTEVEGA